jgi:hypothetical protein
MHPSLSPVVKSSRPSATGSMVPGEPFPAVIVAEVETLSARGRCVRLVALAAQGYAMAGISGAPAPPWDRTDYDILVAVPAAYRDAGLDGFYVKLPYTYHGSTHPRVQGATIELEGVAWQLVSWHYPDEAPWRRELDDLESHLEHCRGFFLNRGARNAIN